MDLTRKEKITARIEARKESIQNMRDVFNILINDDRTYYADKLQLEIEKLVVANWQDEMSLETLTDEEINEVPTLALHKAKLSLTMAIVLILVSLGTFARSFCSFEGQNHGFGLNAGYLLKGINVKVGYDAPLSRKATIPYMFYTDVGYDLRAGNIVITPATGISKYHFWDSVKEDQTKTALLASIEVGKDFTANGSGRVYLFGRKSKGFFAGAGLRLFIK